MAEDNSLKFLIPDEEYTVLVTIAYPDALWEWCERQGGGNPNGYVFQLIREDMRRKGQELTAEG